MDKSCAEAYPTGLRQMPASSWLKAEADSTKKFFIEVTIIFYLRLKLCVVVKYPLRIVWGCVWPSLEREDSRIIWFTM